MKRLAVFVLLVAGLPVARAHVGDHVVSVQDDFFSPRVIKLDPGETITWSVDGVDGHTITEDAALPRFDHRDLRRGDVRTWTTPTTPAVVRYHCERHGAPGSGMWGAIAVGPALSVPDVAIVESQIVSITITLDRPADQNVSLTVSTGDGSARAGQDYVPLSSALTIARGQTSIALPVELVTDDVPEPDESFLVSVSDVMGAGVWNDVALVTITENRLRRVPADYPTIDAALATAPPGTTIELAPGTYRRTAAVSVSTNSLIVRGAGATPGDVVIEPASSGSVASGIEITADAAAVQNLTVRGFNTSGITIERARAFTLDRVALPGNRKYGALITGARDGLVRAVSASGSKIAALGVRGCARCDTIVEDSTFHESGTGFLGRNAGGLVVRRSMFRDNAAGVVLATDVRDDGAPQRASHVVANIVERNTNPRAPVRAPGEIGRFSDLPSGAGIWIDGGANDTVEANAITGHVFGVSVTGTGAPSFGVRVRGNIVGASSGADVAWDGIGWGVCFDRNSRPDGTAPSTEPRVVPVCGATAPVGAPDPVVHATIVAHAHATYYCKEDTPCEIPPR